MKIRGIPFDIEALAVTAPVDAQTVDGNFFQGLPVEAATYLYAGSIGALAVDGGVVAAADVPNIRVLGRIEENANTGALGDTDNTNGALGALIVNVRRGCFLYQNSQTGDLLTAADVNRMCYIEDAQTVNKSGGNNKVVAGRFLGFWQGDTSQYCIIDFTQRPIAESTPA